MERFRQVDFIDVAGQGATRRISLYVGDVANIPENHAVDYLIVSAFPNSYVPTPRSVMKSLADKGLSVGELAANKEYDLRGSCGFWMSRDISQFHPDLNIRRILCFEPSTIGSPPQVVGEIFRGMFPFLDMKNGSTVATSLIATGDQGWQRHQMFRPFIEAAVEWLQRGLPIVELKVIVLSEAVADSLVEEMNVIKAKLTNAIVAREAAPWFDIFLSYSTTDLSAAASMKALLQQAASDIRIFDFKNHVDVGKAYQSVIDESIANCRRIVALMSPAYFASPECKEELNIARLRHKRADHSVLFPIYWKSLNVGLELWIQTLNYVDCREQDESQLALAARHLTNWQTN